MKRIEIKGNLLTLNLESKQVEDFAEWHRNIMALVGDPTNKGFTREQDAECGFLLFMSSATNTDSIRRDIAVAALREVKAVQTRGGAA